jgi:hypothetical protein
MRINSEDRPNRRFVKGSTCAGVIARLVVWSADAAKRSACSLTIRKVFVLTLSFQAKVFL